MQLKEFLAQLGAVPEHVMFVDVMAMVAAHYSYTPQTFSNGAGDDCVLNPAGTNEGSCKVFAFGLLQGLSEQQTLACFGEHYRKVMATPDGSDHGNIRAFMRHGWAGIAFEGAALSPV